MTARKYISAMVSPKQLEMIDANARAAVLSRSEYLRRAALGQQLRTRAEEELYRELVRLGLRLKALPDRPESSILKDLANRIQSILDQMTSK